MKLKYKKIILLTTMSTMGIGLLTLSVSQDRTKAEESLSKGVSVEAGLLADNSASTQKSMVSEVIAEPTALPTLTMAPTPIPTPTAPPVYNIEEEVNPQISSLFEIYYAAKNKSDVAKLKKILSDSSKVESQDDLQKKTEYIEEYLNIKAYAKKGIEDGTYIVYVYHEIKFTSINTPAPGLAKFYVITGEDNKLKIFSGEMDEKTKAYFDERNNDEDVVKLIKMTNKKSKEATDKDEDLQNFWKSIDELANNNQEDTKAEGDSAE
ncbi:MAG: hypothetical protein ACYDEX_17785 [Mobilitalea sp.]